MCDQPKTQIGKTNLSFLPGAAKGRQFWYNLGFDHFKAVNKLRHHNSTEKPLNAIPAITHQSKRCPVPKVAGWRASKS